MLVVLIALLVPATIYGVYHAWRGARWWQRALLLAGIGPLIVWEVAFVVLSLTRTR